MTTEPDDPDLTPDDPLTTRDSTEPLSRAIGERKPFTIFRQYVIRFFLSLVKITNHHNYVHI